jgi:hypothetical protein
MLTVDDDEFWKDMEPLDINGLPAMQVGEERRITVFRAHAHGWCLLAWAWLLGEAPASKRMTMRPVPSQPDTLLVCFF